MNMYQYEYSLHKVCPPVQYWTIFPPRSQPDNSDRLDLRVVLLVLYIHHHAELVVHKIRL